MPDGKVKSEEIEPSFNIDDWVKELLPDSDSSGINRSETAGFPVSSSFLNNSIQQNKSIKMEENCQVSVTNSNIKSSMNRNLVNTSGCVFTDGLNNPVGGFSSTSSNVYNGLAQNQNLSNMILQVDPYQQLHHQVPAQLVEMPNNYTSSARLNAYNSSNQIQQQQNLSTASAMLQQQRSIGYQSPSRLMMRNQESCNVIQQADQSNLEPKLQQFSRQVQMQQPLNMQSGLVSEHAHPKLMTSAFPQSQSRNFQLANQIKSEKQPQQFQGPPQVQMATSADWVDQAFHQILQLKAACLPEVAAIYRRVSEQRNQAQNNETVTKIEKMMLIYGKILSFLRMSKSEVENHGKEKFLRYMNYFGPHLDRIRAKNSLHMQHAQQIDASFSQMITPQLRHRGIVPQFYGTLPNLPGTLRQQRALSPMSSSQVGSSAGVQMSDASSNRHSLIRSTQQPSSSQVPQRISISSPHEGSKIGFEQGSPVKQLHSSSGVPRQLTFSAPHQKVTSSRKIFNPLESSSSEKNNNPNIAKSAQQSLSVEHMQQIMQKRSSGSPLRHFMGLNKSSSSFNIPSPQNSQHSSSPIEFSKSRTPPSLSTSPLAFPSPLNPLTPISKATDSELSSLSLEESNKVPRASPALVDPPYQNEPVTEGLVSSPLVPEPSIPDKDDSSCDKQDPFKRLINVVKSMSSTALHASLREINTVAEMSDRMTGSFRHGEPTMDIVNDLAGDVRKHNDWYFASMYETGMESRMKRQLDSIGSMSEMERHASDMVKRQRKEPNDELLREIEEINKKLIEVVVDARAGHDEETPIIRCSYCPIGLYGNNSFPNTSPQMFPYLVLELTVTDDYPHSSPVILESQPPSCSESEEGKEMWMKAMSNFSSAIRKFKQPVSLQEMAKTWEICARGVYREFAEQNGGGDFSSTYGKWETCAAAS